MKQSGFDQFKGSTDYVTSEALRNAVNVSIAFIPLFSAKRYNRIDTMELLLL